ncbi:hypothetical protein IV454_28200 [Massilia antarctica]|uniref:Hemolysin XhlA n=2 Tax=Massilia antarctica TaxID=2765360 RepID=A0AA48WMF8_9BURK|nr:hypothetical protein IV454_28200 [Massilia antarctica]
MEARMIKLESVTEKILERLAAVERDVAVIRANYATKADLAAVEASLRASIASLEATMLTWFIWTAIALASLAFTAAKLIN